MSGGRVSGGTAGSGTGSMNMKGEGAPERLAGASAAAGTLQGHQCWRAALCTLAPVRWLPAWRLVTALATCGAAGTAAAETTAAGGMTATGGTD